MDLEEIENFLNNKENYDILLDDYKKEYIRFDDTSSHTKEEQNGLASLYDKIEQDSFFCSNTLDLIMLQFNKELYSKTPFPEAGGKYRNSTAVITNSDIKTTEPSLIIKELKILDIMYKELWALKDEINTNANYGLVKNYIDGIMRLKCKLIKIHPFHDGNGRCSRALFNYMLSLISLPPIGIKDDVEKNIYINAMDSAIRTNDYSNIDNFYYKKINESIKTFSKSKTM